MIWIIGVILVVALIVSPTIRCIVFHPFKVVRHGVVDLWFYVFRKGYNNKA